MLNANLRGAFEKPFWRFEGTNDCSLFLWAAFKVAISLLLGRLRCLRACNVVDGGRSTYLMGIGGGL